MAWCARKEEEEATLVSGGHSEIKGLMSLDGSLKDIMNHFKIHKRWLLALPIKIERLSF